MVATSAEVKSQINSAERCAWWVSTKTASGVKTSTAGMLSSLLVSDTSSTMVGILDPLRYDSYLDPTGKPVPSEKQVRPSKVYKPEPGMPTFDSASTVAGIYELFRYDREDTGEDLSGANCRDRQANGSHGQVEHYHQLGGLVSSHTVSTVSEIVEMFQYDDGEEMKIEGKSKDKGPAVDEENSPQSFDQEVEHRKHATFGCGLMATNPRPTTISDLSQVGRGNEYDDVEDWLTTVMTVGGDQEYLSTTTLSASLQLCLPEAAGSHDLSLNSVTGSVVAPSENPNGSKLVAVAPLTSDFYSSTSQLPSSATFPGTSSSNCKGRRRFSLPQLRIPIFDGSRKSDRTPEMQKDISNHDLATPLATPLSPPPTPAAKKQPRRILKRGRTNKENAPCDASASTPSGYPSSKLPARSPLVPILPNREERRSTGPTASSRLKSRQRETFFVFSSEPPPMPALPMVLRPTTRKSARRGWSGPQVASPLSPPNLPRPGSSSTMMNVGPSMDGLELSSAVVPTATGSRGRLVPHGDSTPSRRVTSTLGSTFVGSSATKAQARPSATPRLGPSIIPEFYEQPSIPPRERVGTRPDLDTIYESPSLDFTPPPTGSMDTPMRGSPDAPPPQASFHRTEREARSHILDRFPIPRQASFPGTRLFPPSPHLNGSGSHDVTQFAPSNRQPLAPSFLVGNQVPTQHLGISQPLTPRGNLQDACAQPGVYSGFPGLERQSPQGQSCACAHPTSARAATPATPRSLASVVWWTKSSKHRRGVNLVGAPSEK